jgi:hypothetical protein
VSKVTWSTREDELLAKHYEKDGIAFCIALFPHRSRAAIQGRSDYLKGVKKERQEQARVALADPLATLRRQYEEADRLVYEARAKRDKLRRELNKAAMERALHSGFLRRFA